MNQTRKNPTRIALLVAAVMSLGTAGIAAAQPGPDRSESVKAKRPGKDHRGKRAQRMARFDTNKDGVISPAEKNAMLRTRFAALDLNKDGVLTAAEMQRAHAARMHNKKKNRKAWNKGANGHQGKARKNRKAHKRGQAMTPAQRQARFAKRFARLDTNNDGRVTFGEFASAKHHQGKKGQRKGNKYGKRGQRSQRATPAKAKLIKATLIQPQAYRASFRAQYSFKL